MQISVFFFFPCLHGKRTYYNPAPRYCQGKTGENYQKSGTKTQDFKLILTIIKTHKNFICNHYKIIIFRLLLELDRKFNSQFPIVIICPSTRMCIGCLEMIF